MPSSTKSVIASNDPNIIDDIKALYPPPAPGVAVVTSSTDPGIYANPDFERLLNQQFAQHYMVDNPNAAELVNFGNRLYAWKLAGEDPFGVPAQPAYVYFDLNAFYQWWAQMRSTPGMNAPPAFFVKPFPPGPDVVIAAAKITVVQVVSTDGPVGPAVAGNPGVFRSVGVTDQYADGYVYMGPTGVYQKHIYGSPGLALNNQEIIWLQLQATPPGLSAALLALAAGSNQTAATAQTTAPAAAQAAADTMGAAGPEKTA